MIVVDLDEDDGSFHADEPNFNGHHGFGHDYLLETSRKAGFLATTVKTFCEGEREVLEKKVSYSLFVLCAEKGVCPN